MWKLLLLRWISVAGYTEKVPPRRKFFMVVKLMGMSYVKDRIPILDKYHIVREWYLYRSYLVYQLILVARIRHKLHQHRHHT